MKSNYSDGNTINTDNINIEYSDLLMLLLSVTKEKCVRRLKVVRWLFMSRKDGKVRHVRYMPRRHQPPKTGAVT